MTTPNKPYSASSMLRTALRSNALFSAASGLLFITFAQPLSRWSGVDVPAAFTLIGVGLLPWAFFLFQGSRDRINPALARAAISGDVLWVAGSIAVLLGDWLSLTTAGVWTVAIIADIVALFAVWQFFGLRRMLQRSH